ncbi:hypothetical protein MPSEU_000590900 [Mayamaea pseudoterrestris]|nr:hypothetical protein MPSEU_000590900 [Mayamaea pseudoterrestris]
MDAVVIALANLTAEHIAALAAAGILSIDDLRLVSRRDLENALPGATVMVHRKLELIREFVSKGQALTAETTMATIREYLSHQGNPQQPAGAPAAAPENDLWITTIPLDSFTGADLDWENWEIKARRTIHQSLYATLLTTEPAANDVNAQTLNRAFYLMLFLAVVNGDAYHIVDGVENRNGYEAWQKLVEWYTPSPTRRSLIQYHCQRLREARLDENHTASSYINTFLVSCHKLEQLNAGLPDTIKLLDFLNGIANKDYDITVQIIERQSGLTLDDAVNAIRGREQDLVDKANATGTHTRARPTMV